MKNVTQTYGLELYPLCHSHGLNMFISGIQHFFYTIKIYILNLLIKVHNLILKQMLT